jgi:hypothetical protein
LTGVVYLVEADKDRMDFCVRPRRQLSHQVVNFSHAG